jgi:hypothetical protein
MTGSRRTISALASGDLLDPDIAVKKIVNT